MMANARKTEGPIERREPARKQGAGDESTPATRHVGRTLESDPEFRNIELPADQTPEQLIESGIGVDDENRRDLVSRGTDGERRAQPDPQLRPDEPLKTRLPGDSSSDPHTDVGTDNATTLQREPDIKRSAA